MSLTPSRKPSSGQRSDTSSTHTYPNRVRTADGSPTARTYPSTPRRQAKHTACSDNHGIRPPTPEQYLTPLQQKEVCIRHLRARLRDNVERLQHRDCEIDELRTQLYRMQEDWIEEECHRIEAQLALKEARKEIQHLHEVMDSVRSNLAPQDPHEPKQFSGLHAARPGGRSRSCGCSPASTLSRSTTHTRMSSEALQLERSPNAPESGRASRPAGQTHLLLEAALLTDQGPQQSHIRPPPTVPRSATFERLCTGGAMLPVSHSCHTLSSSCQCSGHSYLPHHHLFLHLPQEEPPQTAAATATPVSDPIPTPSPAGERKPEVRSQACSPTMTWLCEETAAEEELSVISLPTADVTPPESQPLQTTLPVVYPPEHSYNVEPLPQDPPEITKKPAEPQTCQPQSAPPLPVRQEATLLEIDEDNIDESEGTNEDSPPPQLCHWSRYFLVDLLALAMPVVPTVAWLCRGTPREVMPVYHIGSLLRGCCAVALHSLRRRGAGRGRRPASMNGTTSI
ncbi:syntaphilin isoform X2 [Notolabrus celidotus]|uniref:syntaphilin isoform X2 n=1 Tax=Notolabrus celidotus TaxID=1203425 RepID=UPI0014902660|nr:syntaphilin isoform X2 [Notolabrus celidotus]